METVILEKTIIKSKTPKGITEVQTVPWGCGKYLLEMDDRCQHSKVGLSSGTRLWRGRATQNVPFR